MLRPRPVPLPTSLVVKTAQIFLLWFSSDMPVPESDMVMLISPLSNHVLTRISPCFSIAWAALTSIFMKTWFSCPGLHTVRGISPYSLTSVALYLSSFHTMLIVLSRPELMSRRFKLRFIYAGEILKILDYLLDSVGALKGFIDQVIEVSCNVIDL